MQRQSITRVCLFCEATFTTRPSRIAAGKGRYCSTKCAYAARFPTPEARFWPNVAKSNCCWLWTGAASGNGYGAFYADGRYIGAHRFSYQLANGPIPEHLLVCHNCPDGDNPLCVNPAHLFLGTHQGNMADRQLKGRSAKGVLNGAALHPEQIKRGEEAPASKLSAAQVMEIRRRFAAKERYDVIAVDYGISSSTVYRVVNRRYWRHI